MSNLKPFNLARALAGDPMVTEDGRKVEIVLYDGDCSMFVFKVHPSEKLNASAAPPYLTTGTNVGWTNAGIQIYMTNKKQVRYGAIYRDSDGREWVGNIHESKDSLNCSGYVAIGKIEWEE